jgi:hypothetical protein
VNSAKSCATAELARQKAADPPQAFLFGFPETVTALVQRRRLFAINAGTVARGVCPYFPFLGEVGHRPTLGGETPVEFPKFLIMNE